MCSQSLNVTHAAVFARYHSIRLPRSGVEEGICECGLVQSRSSWKSYISRQPRPPPWLNGILQLTCTYTSVYGHALRATVIAGVIVHQQLIEWKLSWQEVYGEGEMRHI